MHKSRKVDQVALSVSCLEFILFLYSLFSLTLGLESLLFWEGCLAYTSLLNFDKGVCSHLYYNIISITTMLDNDSR